MAFRLFGKGKKYPFSKQKKKEAPAAVYAGPEYFQRRYGGGRLYAGPEPSRPGRDEADSEVYAGPEFFEDRLPPRGGGEEDAPLPPEEAPVYAGPKPPLLIYAGPEFFARRRKTDADEESAPFNGVYAGPAPGRGAAPPSPGEDGKE